jgi:hypothetical protein
MKELIDAQIKIISSLQRVLLKELGKKDGGNKADIEFFNSQIKFAIEGLDVLKCLPEEIDEIDGEIDEDDED